MGEICQGLDFLVHIRIQIDPEWVSGQELQCNSLAICPTSAECQNTSNDFPKSALTQLLLGLEANALLAVEGPWTHWPWGHGHRSWSSAAIRLGTALAHVIGKGSLAVLGQPFLANG